MKIFLLTFHILTLFAHAFIFYKLFCWHYRLIFLKCTLYIFINICCWYSLNVSLSLRILLRSLSLLRCIILLHTFQTITMWAHAFICYNSSINIIDFFFQNAFFTFLLICVVDIKYYICLFRCVFSLSILIAQRNIIKYWRCYYFSHNNNVRACFYILQFIQFLFSTFFFKMHSLHFYKYVLLILIIMFAYLVAHSHYTTQ